MFQQNYRPNLKLPFNVFAFCYWKKIFERILYNNMYELFTESNWMSPNQSSFPSGNSCINQLPSVTHEIHKSFDDGLEVRGMFLDIPKAFGKIWHKGILYKQQQNGISGKLFDITNFLNFRKFFKLQLFSTNNILHGLVLKPRYVKDQYLDHCCFWFTLIISLMI